MFLFCLPYAGGSEKIYSSWKAHLNPQLKLYPIELKGRGRRFNESFYENLEQAVEDIYMAIEKLIKTDNYAIYGHSMGSLLGYELYHKILEMNEREPSHMFFSGKGAPNIIRDREISHTLPNDIFIKRIIDLGGTPNEIISNNELLDIFLPILRNDFKIIETYQYKEKKNTIKCDISILNGNKDDLSLNEILEWKNHTLGKCKFYTLNGDHFFINNNIEAISDIINNTLF